MLTTIVRHMDSNCQDPRDKIYGFKGITSDGHCIPVNYDKPFEDALLNLISGCYSPPAPNAAALGPFSDAVSPFSHIVNLTRYLMLNLMSTENISLDALLNQEGDILRCYISENTGNYYESEFSSNVIQQSEYYSHFPRPRVPISGLERKASPSTPLLA